MKTKILRLQKFTRLRSIKGVLRKRYYFRCRAENNEIVFPSQSYTTASARNKTAKLLAESKIEVAK